MKSENEESSNEQDRKSENKKSGSRKKRRYGIIDNYRYVYKMMWEFDKSVLFYSGLEIIFSVIGPFLAVVLPAVIIYLLESGISIGRLAISLLAIFAAAGSILGIQTYLQERNNFQYVNMRGVENWAQLCVKYLELDMEIIEREETGKSLSKACSCLGGNNWGLEGFEHFNVELVTNVLGLILYACIISSIHPVIIVMLLGISMIQLLVYRRAQNYELKHRDAKAKIGVTQDYLRRESNEIPAGKDIRLYQLAPWLNAKYQEQNQKRRKLLIKEKQRFYVNDLVDLILQFVRDIVCYGYLIYLLKHGLSISYFVLYLGVVSGFSKWFTVIFDDVAKIGGALELICDLREFLNTKNESIHNGGEVIDPKVQAVDIVFEHVSFTYRKAEEPVLEDISFHIPAGKRYALVGINGAGKTTIVKLMVGFYQPTSGRILVNGKEIRKLNIIEYFKLIAVVFQETFSHSFTIGENVAGMTVTKDNRERVEQSIKKAGLWSKISQLPDGYDTYLNKDIREDGIQLSGGEQQKLMLARAIYKDAKLLILDEPTAALDAIAESEMYERYQKVLSGKTSLFISHRLASTRFCDNILYLEKGKIVEQGSHEELMQLGGKYYEMFEIQSKYYKEGLEDEKIQTILSTSV